MLQTLKRHVARDDEDGFTLIELMVVVLIIAILLAIAIPTFLGARERAQDRAAQSDIRNALAAEKVFYTDNETYTSVVTPIRSIEPSLSYVAGAGTKEAVGLKISTNGNTLCVDKVSKGGTTFSLMDVATGAGAGTYYAKTACAATVSDHTTTGAPSGYKTGGW